MKRLLFLVVFIVSWQTYVAKFYPGTLSPVNSMDGRPLYGPQCELEQSDQTKEFPTLEEAQVFAEELKTDRKNWDIKIIERKERVLERNP